VLYQGRGWKAILNKIKTLISLFFTVCLVSCSTYQYNTSQVKEEIQSIFKNTRIDEVKPSEIPGVYEVYYTGMYPGIVYYYPAKKIIIFGEFWSVNGTSLSGEKLVKFLEEKGVDYGKTRPDNSSEQSKE